VNSLRARIAAILIASIALVVCLATITTFLVVRPSGEESFVRPIARQLDIISALAGAELRAGGPSGLFEAAPAAGESREHLASLIGAGLAEYGGHRRVVVTRPPGDTQPIASLEIAPGYWFELPVPDEPSLPETFSILGGWMLLILLGAAAISLAVAHRATLPLLLLEAFAEGIGPNGEPRPVPETGPAEVRATARALNRLNANLRRAVESRMRLVAAAGHDLRTPLTRMRLRAEFLDDGERRKWLHDIDELERIADSAILLVREEMGADDRIPLRLDTMVSAIADELAAMGLPVAVAGAAPVSIVGPPLAITRAFRNLIINAATHGGGAEVTVEERDGRAVLLIDDRGPGIPAGMLDRVFEPFFRVDPSRRQPAPGAGLGLAIAREIVSRAGGELTLRNRPIGGLRQEVAFPSAPEDMAGKSGRAERDGVA
jgi:signal transduction histidine kinase